MLQVRFIKTEAPRLIKKAEEDITDVERTAERLRTAEEQLVGDVCNHLADVQPMVTMLSTLTGQIQELEKYSQYLHCLAEIEDLRFLLQFRLVELLLVSVTDIYCAEPLYVAYVCGRGKKCSATTKGLCSNFGAHILGLRNDAR